jgi:hypothetical protein
MVLVSRWYTYRTYVSMMIDVEQSSLAQVNLFEDQVERIR